MNDFRHNIYVVVYCVGNHSSQGSLTACSAVSEHFTICIMFHVDLCSLLVISLTVSLLFALNVLTLLNKHLVSTCHTLVCSAASKQNCSMPLQI